jgi:hypothetical protein
MHKAAVPSRIRIPVSVCPSFFPACREGVWMIPVCEGVWMIPVCAGVWMIPVCEGVWMIPVCEGVWMIPVAFSLLRSSTLSLSGPLAPFLSPSLVSSLPSPSLFFWTVMRGALQHSAGASRVPCDKGASHP